MKDEEIMAFVKASEKRVEEHKIKINKLTERINRIFIG